MMHDIFIEEESKREMNLIIDWGYGRVIKSSGNNLRGKKSSGVDSISKYMKNILP